MTTGARISGRCARDRSRTAGIREAEPGSREPSARHRCAGARTKIWAAPMSGCSAPDLGMLGRIRCWRVALIEIDGSESSLARSIHLIERRPRYPFQHPGLRARCKPIATSHRTALTL
jgi:hypothetical protein